MDHCTCIVFKVGKRTNNEINIPPITGLGANLGQVKVLGSSPSAKILGNSPSAKQWGEKGVNLQTLQKLGSWEVHKTDDGIAYW